MQKHKDRAGDIHMHTHTHTHSSLTDSQCSNILATADDKKIRAAEKKMGQKK